MTEVVKLKPDLPPHLETLVIGKTLRGAYICVHQRQLSICAVCAPEAERLRRTPWEQLNKAMKKLARVNDKFLEGKR